ncbi:MAG: DUF4846 domain-containing protein [Pseudomonadota bacterium]|nr:DUF4846 domain-containing protein [Pseudomonadota bacterium]
MFLLVLVAVVRGETVLEGFPPPAGASRVEADAFGAWLRARPLHPEGRPVLTHKGDVVPIGAARVLDLPIGTRDLQQCADSALRLRATWERTVGRAPAFHYTSGYLSTWAAWAGGTRVKVSGSKVQAVPGAATPSDSDAAFEGWLMDLFMYAGTRSLPLDTVAVTTPLPGDIVVQPGSPGHAVVLLDVATDGARSWVLVGQGYMPAMDFHVVAGPAAGWFPVEGDMLPTTPLAVPWSGLRRWK